VVSLFDPKVTLTTSLLNDSFAAEAVIGVELHSGLTSAQNLSVVFFSHI
jgi:hypothetical protein